MRSTALVLGVLLCGVVAQAEPRVGEPAPAFSLQGSDGKTHKLADSVGKRAVVIGWFPKAFTPG